MNEKKFCSHGSVFCVYHIPFKSPEQVLHATVLGESYAFPG
jgi:hypothetical protein